MQYLLDTVTVVRHFAGTGKIGRKAACILDSIEESDDVLFISIISLMEIMYLSEKNRITVNLQDTLKRVQNSSKYMIADLDSDILRTAETVNFYELHDRLILATAKWLDIPVISSDKEFKKIREIEVIWN